MRDRVRKQRLSHIRCMRYAEKRQHKAWYARKHRARQTRRSMPTIEWYTAPRVFSIVENAVESLEYLSMCGEVLRQGKHVGVDLERVTRLTPDMIPLLIALVCDKNYRGMGRIHGNMPKAEEPKALFASSGFLKFVRTSMKNREGVDPEHCQLVNDRNLRFGEQAEGAVAKGVCVRIANQTFMRENLPVEFELYPIIMEVTLNTKNHASPDELIKWWIYTHNDTKTGDTSCTILDLGSGIFESRVGKVKNFSDRIFRLFSQTPSHMEIAQAILDGTIVSAKEQDQDLRGKGLQQILNISQSRYISKAVLYSNDIKIDLKGKEKELLQTNLRGTFYHFEITNRV